MLNTLFGYFNRLFKKQNNDLVKFGAKNVREYDNTAKKIPKQNTSQEL